MTSLRSEVITALSGSWSIDAKEREELINRVVALVQEKVRQNEEMMVNTLSNHLFVHANMARGTIAKLTPNEIAHLYGDDDCAAIVREIERQRPAAIRARREG